MTTEIVARGAQTAVQATEVASRPRATAGLLAAPGFLELCVSNALAHSFGQRIQGIAVAWLVLEMTGSKFWLGVVNGGPALAIVLFSLIGGVTADSRDSRRVLLASRSLLAATAAVAALLVMTGQAGLGQLLVYVLIVVAIAAIDMPVSRTMVHDVAGSERLLEATGLQSVFMNGVNIVAPVTIGVLIGVAGAGAAFWLLGGGYALAALLLLRMRSGGHVRRVARSNPLSETAAGLAYIRSTPTVAALVGLAFLVPVAGIYFAMVPVYAREVLSVGATGLGVLVASFSVGSLVGSVYLATHGTMGRKGATVSALGVAFGVGMIAFALSQSFVLSCAVSFVMGVIAGFWQNMLSAMVQVAAAPEMRGRVLGVFTMGFQLMGAGWLLGGTFATLAGAEATVLAGGVVFSALSLAAFALSKGVREID